MGHYKAVVMDYLQSDWAFFVNTACGFQPDETIDPDRPGRYYSCDAVALDLRHGAVYLCETATDRKLQPLIKKLSAWTTHWNSIKAALQRDCRVPANWRVYVWLFVPKDSIEALDGELEHLRRTSSSKFKIKITALEDVQAWRASISTRS